MAGERTLRALYPLLLVPILFSMYVHSPLFDPPQPLFGLKYTDFTVGVFLPVFMNPEGGSERWFNSEKLERFKEGVRTCPLPYLDYHFEYPPLIGLLWALSTCASIFLVFPPSFSPAEYGELIQGVQQLHYYITAIYLFLSYLVVVLLLPSMTAERWRPYALLLLPSVYVLSIYNWDILAVSLFLSSLYAFERGRHELSGALAGLSVSTKLLTVFGGIIMGLTLLREGRREGFMRYSIAFAAAVILPHLTLFLLSPRGFSHMISHHASWYCENCLYMLLSSDIWSDAHRVMAALSIGFLVGSFVTLSFLKTVDARSALFASVSVPITFNYVFTPQMMVMLAPLAALALPLPLFALYAVADTLNAAAILVFFNEPEPWTLPSAAQKLFMGRNVVMAALTLAVVATLFRKRG